MALSRFNAPMVSLCSALEPPPPGVPLPLALSLSSTSVSASLVNDSSDDGPRYWMSPCLFATSWFFAGAAPISAEVVLVRARAAEEELGLTEAGVGGERRFAASSAIRSLAMVFSMRSRRSLTSSNRWALRLVPRQFSPSHDIGGEARSYVRDASLSRFWRSE